MHTQSEGVAWSHCSWGRSIQCVSGLVHCSFPQVHSLLLEIYAKNVPNNELGTVECFMQEREVASLGLLLKTQGEGFCVICFLLQKRHEPTQLVPTNSPY